MTEIINSYIIETGYGFNPNKSTVREIKGVDACGRFIIGACVFGGTWEECEKYAKTH